MIAPWHWWIPTAKVHVFCAVYYRRNINARASFYLACSLPSTAILHPSLRPVWVPFLATTKKLTEAALLFIAIHCTRARKIERPELTTPTGWFRFRATEWYWVATLEGFRLFVVSDMWWSQAQPTCKGNCKRPTDKKSIRCSTYECNVFASLPFICRCGSLSSLKVVKLFPPSYPSYSLGGEGTENARKVASVCPAARNEGQQLSIHARTNGQRRSAPARPR